MIFTNKNDTKNKIMQVVIVIIIMTICMAILFGGMFIAIHTKHQLGAYFLGILLAFMVSIILYVTEKQP